MCQARSCCHASLLIVPGTKVPPCLGTPQNYFGGLLCAGFGVTQYGGTHGPRISDALRLGWPDVSSQTCYSSWARGWHVSGCSDCYRLNHKIYMLKPQAPGLQNVTLFGDLVVAYVIN